MPLGLHDSSQLESPALGPVVSMPTDDHFQPDASNKRYDNVYVSDYARAVVGDAHYHIQIRGEQLENGAVFENVDVGEIQTVSNLAWKLYKSCKSDPDAFNNISQDLTSLRAVLEECEEVFPHVAKPPKRARRLKTISMVAMTISDSLKPLWSDTKASQ